MVTTLSGFAALPAHATTDVCAKTSFDIPAQRADEALIEFAQQAELTLIVSFEALKEKQANKIAGYLTPLQAARQLLDGTGLYVGVRSENALSITTNKQEMRALNALREECDMAQDSKHNNPLKHIAAAITAMFAVAVDAQPAGARDTSRIIEEVIVTAQKRAESVQDVPISITALNRSMLQAASIDSMTELGSVTPGLLSAETSGSFTPYIRGVGTAASTPGNESPTASYVDGVYLVDKSGLLLTAFNDVESIEVLKGPQGTLFGRNATAGAISVKTRAPQQQFAADIEATAGSDLDNVALYITGGLTDVVSVSLSAFFENEYDYIDNLNPGNGLGNELGSSKSRGARGKLLWEPSDRLSMLFAADYVDVKDTGNAAFRTAKGSSRTTAEAVAAGAGVVLPDVRSRERVYSGSVPADMTGVYSRGSGLSQTLKWNGDNFGFTSISAYRESTSGRSIDADMSPLNVFFLTMEMSTKTIQQEFIFSSNTDGPFSWLAGLFYLDYADGYDNLNFVVGINDLNPALLQAPGQAIIDRGAEIDITSSAIYGEIGYDLTSQTSVTLGLRYTDEKQELDGDNFANTLVSNGAGGFTTLPTPGKLSNLCNVRADCQGLDSSFDEMTWRMVLNHHFASGALAYLSYNRGFKSGVYNLSDTVTYTPTKPEIVDAYELGLKGRLFDESLSFSTALFHNDYSEKQVLVSDNNIQRSVNAATVSIAGLELDIQWKASRALYLQTGISVYFDAQFDDFENCVIPVVNPAGGYLQVGGECSGSDIPYTPDYQAYITGNYTFDLANGSQLELGGLLNYSDDYLFDVQGTAANAIKTPEYEAHETLNLYAKWTSSGDQYFVKGWAKNVTDQDEIGGMLLTTFGTGSVYQRGRTYGITVGASY